MRGGESIEARGREDEKVVTSPLVHGEASEREWMAEEEKDAVEGYRTIRKRGYEERTKERS